jgi:signal transduction histidine kinase
MRLPVLRSPPPLLGYAAAVLLVVVAYCVESVLSPALRADVPTLLVVVPTIVAAWYGGLGPGLVAAALSAVAIEYHIADPTQVRAVLRGSLFASESVIVALLMAEVRASSLHAQSAARRVKAMYDMSAALAAATSTYGAAEVIVNDGLSVLEGTAAAVFLTSGGGESLQLLAHNAHDPRVAELMRRFATVPFDSELPAATAARERKVIHSGDRKECERKFPSLHDLVASGLPPTFLCAPMLVGDRLAGVLTMSFAEARRFDHDELNWAGALGRDCGMAIERTILFENERRTRIEAQTASRAKDEFLATVSHALQAPLSTITEGARELGEDRRNRTRRSEALDRMASGVQAESRIVDGLLALSHIAAQELRVERRPLDLVRVVRSCTDALRQRAATGGVELKARLRGRVNVIGDVDQLGQVVGQLIGNALQFTRRGGHVNVDVEAVDHRARLRVSDDGQGIAPDVLPHVFEPFRRAERRADGGGLGIGLAIAQYVAHQHGGAIKIDSAGDGRGTTSTLELPLEPSPVA